MSLFRLLVLAACTASSSAAPVINEIMFHPPGAPEDTGLEWVEIYNPDPAPVSLGGWKFTKGISLKLPDSTMVPGGGYLVVASSKAKFQLAHPGFSGPLVGNWSGKLSNNSETVRLEDSAGNTISEVDYATEGDWGLRARGPLSLNHRGWIWVNLADGGDRTLEVRNARLPIDGGQNWGVSTTVGGTPGAANSLSVANIAPLIRNPWHKPEIPTNLNAVTISCELVDEANAGSATLFWRPDASTWRTAPMTDTDGDGDVEAVIPAQIGGTIVEWYISATDGTNVRAWPAPARTSFPGVTPETFGQATNALYQVDNTFNSAATFRTAAEQPIYRLILTAAERNELVQLQSSSSEAQSNARFNGVFISHDGTGVKAQYQCEIGNRGFSSAVGPPNNYIVGFPTSDRWNGRGSMGLNCRFGYSQALGQALFARAGLPAQDAAIVRVRLNGVDRAETTDRMFGRYVRVEGRGSGWAEHHFPEDPDGNLYRLDDHAAASPGNPVGNLGSGEFRYEGSDPLAYSDTFIKETNSDSNDYSDIIQLAKVVSAPATGGTAAQPAIANADYPAAVSAFLDLDQFYRFIATDALIGNQEGGLQSGRSDDASIYRGVLDPRFRFIPHDLDDVFDIGQEAGNPLTRSIFSYEGNLGLTRLFTHPQLVPRYYAAVLDALNSWFNRATVDPIVDQIMAGWVPASDFSSFAPNRGIAEIKAYVDTRRASVLGQIQQNYSLVITGNAASTPEGYTVTTTGAATMSGTFNVAKVYSITVNGQPAQLNYRAGVDPAGTWKYVVPASGAGIVNRGLNRIVVRFWDSPNGTGTILKELTGNVFYSGAFNAGISGTLLPPGSLTLSSADAYVPGVPTLVRVDLRDSLGQLNRSAWNSTVNLTASNGAALSPNTLTLYNGVGSALVTVGNPGGGAINYFSYGSGGNGSTGSTSGTSGSEWRALVDLTSETIGSVSPTWKDETFDDSAWGTLPTHTGFGDGDENHAFVPVDFDAAAPGAQVAPSCLFRATFTISSVAQLGSVTGEVTFDDACAVYVNGVEIYRHADLTTNAPLTEYTEFTTAVTRENARAALNIPLNLLHDGANVIAVEVHQHDAASDDLTFDLRLQGNLLASDPGSFTLAATTGGISATKTLGSLGATVGTVVSGELPAGVTNWSGVVRVEGDVTVPAGSTLNIAAGTQVLMFGTSAPGDTAGADLIVNGALNVTGTLAQPVHITCSDPNARWGQIYLDGAAPTTCTYLHVSRGGHAPGAGHTFSGAMWRLNNSSLSLIDSAMGDAPAKALYSQGACDLIVRRSLLARMITGPELEDGASLLMEDSNIQEILPNYRESNAAAPDDEDCLYVHNNSGRPVNVRRSVLARCGDDVIDCLGGAISVEDCIVRDGWDKGLSLLNNDLTITRSLIVGCDKAIVPKSNTAATRTINIDRCTLISENHNTTLPPWGYSVLPSSPDPDTASTGLYTQNKSGQSHAGATLAITATNCIILAEAPILVDSPYNPANTAVNYSITRDTDTPDNPVWNGSGNSNANPGFRNLAEGDYRLAAGSPAINTGDPAAFDPDGSRADMGALPSGISPANVPSTEIVWSAGTGPYLVSANTTVPPNLTLRIQPGTSVHFAKNARLTVNGRLIAEGTAGQRIVFSHVPGTLDSGDSDPIKNGTQTGPAKWGGIRVVDSMAQENIVRYCDFLNAQGTSTVAPENFGSIGFIRSWGWVDHCTWAGTHLRMCYGRNSKMTVTWNQFPDMFLFDSTLARIEEPADFIASADNNQEPLKVEYPTTDAEVSGNSAYANGQPVGGHFRVYFNDFNGNRGHNDVFDADSGRWNVAGQYLLDCRYNHFHGISGDEHIDLGGDAYIASNIFERAAKDAWTSDTGYSNAISSGDKGPGTTIVVARNLFFDLDHAINCKLNTGTIFEHNTVANFHADFAYSGVSFGTPFTQDVKCAPVNFFIPEDGFSPSYGDGAYFGYNLVSNVPRLFSGADTRKLGGTLTNDITTKIELYQNLLDQIGTGEIGPNHPGGVSSGTYGPNSFGAPGFVSAASADFRLQAASLARERAPGGLDFGWTVPEWAYVIGGPVGVTASTDASFTIGGPGIVAYKWRLDGGAWSVPVQIGSGGVFPRVGATTRQATLNLSALSAGGHTLEVLGQDAAGNWQDADPARQYDGAAQLSPSIRTWSVSAVALLRINEIFANGSTLPDRVEIYNAGNTAVLLSGWSLSDDPAIPGKVPLPAITLAPGTYTTVTNANLGLDKDGDTIRLYQGITLREAVAFGPQALDYSIGRIAVGSALEWRLGTPSFGSANNWVPVGDTQNVRISEWMASGEVLFDYAWLELSNSSAAPAAIAGLRIANQRSDAASHFVFPPLSFIEPNGYLKLIADSDDEPGHLPFTLDAQQETLSLLAPSGQLLDTVNFYPQTTDYSMGSGGSVFYELPTPGISNSTSNSNALALLRGLRITEIMFNALGGSDYDYLELRNVGGAAFNLNGVSFVEGITFTFPSQVLNPGANIVVVKNLSKFRLRYGQGPLVAGTYSGQLDNGGEKVALRLPSPFEVNILTFDYQDGWFASADGEGTSLVTIAAQSTLARDWDEKGTWASSIPGGDPGGVGARSDTFSGWMALHRALDARQDDDMDGVPALVEFGLGMNPASGLGMDGQQGLPVAGIGAGAQMQIHFLVPQNPLAGGGLGFEDAILRVDASDDLKAWTPIAAKTFGSPWAGTVATGEVVNGYVPVTVTDTTAPTGNRRFLRFRVESNP